tara:strand:- start:11 stop:265 length:255 start_codon:yes stop_codon:yes gene_type:complete
MAYCLYCVRFFVFVSSVVFLSSVMLLGEDRIGDVNYDGIHYVNAVVRGITPSTVTIIHSKGIAQLDLKKLDERLKWTPKTGQVA